MEKTEFMATRAACAVTKQLEPIPMHKSNTTLQFQARQKLNSYTRNLTILFKQHDRTLALNEMQENIRHKEIMQLDKMQNKASQSLTKSPREKVSFLTKR